MQSTLGMLQNDREKTKLPMEKLGVSRETPTNSNLSGGFVSRWVLLQSSAAQLFHRFFLWTRYLWGLAKGILLSSFTLWLHSLSSVVFWMSWFLKLHACLSSGWDQILCEIQIRLITRHIKFGTFGPSCKIKSMPVAAFHNLVTSWLSDAIKMLHLQVILLAFIFVLWLTGLALKSTYTLPVI